MLERENVLLLQKRLEYLDRTKGEIVTLYILGQGKLKLVSMTSVIEFVKFVHD